MLHYKIIENFEKEYTIFELSEKYKIDEEILYKELENYYKEKDNLRKFSMINYNIENNIAKNNLKSIIKDFEEGLGTRSLAKKYNTTRYNIMTEIKKYYEFLDKKDKYKTLISSNNKSKGNGKYKLTKEIIEDYKNNKSILAISKENNIPYTTLRRMLENIK